MSDDQSNVNQNINIREIIASQTIPLRHQLLWPDRPRSYVVLPEDEHGLHFGAFDGVITSLTQEPIAIISLFRGAVPAINEGANANSPCAARFRKFACLPEKRNCGIGSALLTYVSIVAKERWNAEVLWCDARAETLRWYKKRGMEEFGDRFYKGDIEYVKMAMRL